MIKRIAIWGILYTLNWALMAQDITLPQIFGHPFIQNYSSDDFNSTNQNLDVIQGDNGLIYVANSSGILEFDGITWRIIAIPNGQFVRSFAKAVDGTIYVACHDQFGLLAPDSTGTLDFHSLLSHVPEAYLDFEVVLKVHVTSHGVYFCADKYLFRWEPETSTLTVLCHGINTNLAYVVYDDLYLRQYDVGLVKLVGDSLVTLPGGEFFSKDRIHLMLPFGGKRGFSESAILIGLSTRGLYVYDQGEVIPFDMPPEDAAYFRENAILAGQFLSNGHIAIAAMKGGAVIIDTLGNIKETVTRSSGLIDALVTNVYEDRQGTIWMSLYDGLARAEIASPFRLFTAANGLEINLNSVAMYGGELYVGGPEGMFRLTPSGTPRVKDEFTPVKGLNQQLFDIVEVEGDLLAAMFTGVYRISGDQIEELVPGQTLALHPSSFHPEILYVGLIGGVMVMKKFPVGWRKLGTIPGTKGEVRTIVETAPGELWAGFEDGFSHIYLDTTALWEITSSSTSTQLPAHVTHYEELDGKQHAMSYVFSINKQVVLDSPLGKFVYDSTKKDILRDTLFDKKYPASDAEPFYLHEDPHGDVWIESFMDNEKFIDWFSLQKDGRYSRQFAPFFHLSSIETIYKIYVHPADPTTVWFAGDNGLVQFDKSHTFDPSPKFPPLVRKVSIAQGEVIFGGSQQEGKYLIPYEANEMAFEYAFPAYDEHIANEFQYRLEGFEEQWSSWSKETKKSYTNLSEGTYQFRVRAKNIYKETAESDAFTFTILPPWYRTWWAYLGYIALLVGGVYLLVKWRVRRLKQQNRELEQVVKERTSEVLEAREQLFMQEKMASLGQMTAGVAHEIKNPLNFVNNFAQGSTTLAADLEEELAPFWEKLPKEDAEIIREILEDIKENAQSIHKHGLRADTIINGMMEHVQRTPGQRRPYDLNQLIEDNLQFAYHGGKPGQTEVRIDIRRHLDASLPPVTVIPQDIGRVFLNLFQNALYALYQKAQQADSAYQPVLEVTSLATDMHITIKVWDNGVGIPVDIKESIFTPFFTTKPTGEGNIGLGLSICYDIIVLGHKGTLTVDSKAGEFTEFVVQLPLG